MSKYEAYCLRRFSFFVLLFLASVCAGNGALFLDDFEYVVNRNTSGASDIFVAQGGWSDVKTYQDSVGSAGYLYTADNIEGYSGVFPGGGNRVLVMEAKPETFQAQTDFYLQYGSGEEEIGYIPADHWYQFWIYAKNYSNEQSLFSQGKFIYPNRATYYPATLNNEGYVYLLSLDKRSKAPLYLDPCPGGDSVGCESAFFGTVWNSGNGANVSNHIEYEENSFGQTLSNEQPILENTWTLVKVHIDLTGTDSRAVPGQAVYEMWIKRLGDTLWTKTAEYIGGVTEVNGQAINFVPAFNDGFRTLRMPTTTGETGPQKGDWFDYWLYMDDFAIADTEAELPTYGSPVGDTTDPSTPQNLVATVASSTQIDLSWDAGTDNIGVTGYKVYRNGSEIANVATSMYSNTALSPNTTYAYTVSAYDAAGNEGLQSASVLATTQSSGGNSSGVLGPGRSVQITSFPYVNSFESVDDVLDAMHVSSGCVGKITYESVSGWEGSGAFKMRIMDHPSAECAKNEDIAGIGTFDWPDLPGQTQMNIGMLTYFGSNFYQPMDNDSGAKWMLFRISNGERPMLALRPYGGGSDFKLFQACQSVGGEGCQDEFGNMYPSDSGIPESDYTFQFGERQGEWIWIEWEVVVGGNNTIYIYTQDGVLSGEYASTSSGLPNGVTVEGFNELAYWEGAQGTTSESYFKLDELTFSNSFIGPPAGFVSGGRGGETTYPSTPQNLVATVVSSTQIDLSWDASTDNIGVTGYRVYRNGSMIASMETTSYSDTGLSANTTYSYAVSAFDAAGNEGLQSLSVSTTTQTGSSEPIISNGQPSSNLAQGTTTTTLSVTTDEPATCKYSMSAGLSYSAMMFLFSGSGSTSHSVQVDNLTDGNSYRYYVKCEDSLGNANLNDYLIIFSVSMDSTPPILSNAQPTGTLVVGTTQTIMSITSDEIAFCRYSPVAGTAFTMMIPFTNTNSTSHNFQLGGLTDGSSYNYYVKCEDGLGNRNVDDYQISFSVDTALACILTNTYWQPLVSEEGQQVQLIVEGQNCAGEQLNFEIFEDDGGIGDDNVQTNPDPISFNGSTAIANWPVEWQCDGNVLGVCTAGTPEYYFVATLVSNPIQTLSSSTNTVDELIVSSSDITAPLLSNINVDVTQTSATISWISDEDSTTYMEYGLNVSYGNAVNVSGLRTTHSVTISDLTVDTTYFYNIRSEDNVGNLGLYPNSFKTLKNNLLPRTGGNSGGSRGGTSSLELIEAIEEECISNYTYGEWSVCESGWQNRIVSDSNTCKEEKTEIRQCEIENTEEENKYLSVKELQLQVVSELRYTAEIGKYLEIFYTQERVSDDEFIVFDSLNEDEYYAQFIEERNGKNYYSIERVSEEIVNELEQKAVAQEVAQEETESLQKGKAGEVRKTGLVWMLVFIAMTLIALGLIGWYFWKRRASVAEVESPFE